MRFSSLFLFLLLFLFIYTPVILHAQYGWINEIHYDNVGVDTLEIVEVVLQKTEHAEDWKLFLYDGVSGLAYDSISGESWESGYSDENFAIYSWYPDAMQNGPDGIVLTFRDSVIQFLSYEGSFTAVSGVAMDLTSTMIPLEESSASTNSSLQLKGAGSRYAHFWWEPGSISGTTLNEDQNLTFLPVLVMTAPDSIEFGTVPFGNSSHPVAYQVAGANLEDPVDISLPDGFEASFQEDFNDSVYAAISLQLTEDYLPRQHVFVRFTPGPVSGLSYKDTVVHKSAGIKRTFRVAGKEGPYPVPNVWINEIHYDNDGPDISEFIELVLADSWRTEIPYLSLHLYNGNTLTEYRQSFGNDWEWGYEDPEGFLYLVAEISGIQNGPADGILLAHRLRPVQFLSYEGELTPVDGPAAGLNSQDIGVMEETDSPAGSSLQLIGTGGSYTDFSWVYYPDNQTRGMPNLDQVLPVRITSFRIRQAGEQVIASWFALDDRQNAGFRLLWSEDGFYYEPIAYVAPKEPGDSNFYEYRLNGVQGGYLKLVQEDLDGKMTSHPPLKYERSKEGIENAEVAVYNAHGQLVHFRKFESWGTEHMDSLLEGLSAGFYLLRIQYPEGLSYVKVFRK